jgi:hypothetical protein
MQQDGNLRTIAWLFNGSQSKGRLPFRVKRNLCKVRLTFGLTDALIKSRKKGVYVIFSPDRYRKISIWRTSF